MMDEKPTDFAKLKDLSIAIVGLGLMGGSLAMVLHGKCRTLIGIDNDKSTLELAKKLKIADIFCDLEQGLGTSPDLVILATPIQGILKTIDQLPNIHPGSAIILDIGSTKKEILEKLKQLPERFDPIGGHPMCGKEKSSLQNSEPNLFLGSRFALCPLERTSPSARHIASIIVHLLGATELWTDVDSHDYNVAMTSHLPFLAANALAAITDPDSAPLAGPGFRSTTRVGETNPNLMLEVIISNKKNILNAMGAYINHLKGLETQINDNDWGALKKNLSSGCENRKKIIDSSERIN